MWKYHNRLKKVLGAAQYDKNCERISIAYHHFDASVCRDFAATKDAAKQLNAKSKTRFPTEMPLPWAKEHMIIDTANITASQGGYLVLPTWSQKQALFLHNKMKMEALASSPDHCETILEDACTSSGTARTARRNRLTANDTQALVDEAQSLATKQEIYLDKHADIMSAISEEAREHAQHIAHSYARSSLHPTRYCPLSPVNVAAPLVC